MSKQVVSVARMRQRSAAVDPGRSGQIGSGAKPDRGHSVFYQRVDARIKEPPATSYGTTTTGTGERRARLTATEPTTRCIACDELPTTITTLSSGCASRRTSAAAISSSEIGP